MRRILSLPGTVALTVLVAAGAWAAQANPPAASQSEEKAMSARSDEGKEKASPDAWLTMKTTLALITADGVPGMAINVDTKDGEVTLRGKVGTDAESAKAERVARDVGGVKSVTNLLQVVPAGRKEAVKALDSDVKERVKKALDADESLHGIQVESVDNGLVLLAGKAPLAVTLRAVQAVAAVPGVRRVSSQVEITDKQ